MTNDLRKVAEEIVDINLIDYPTNCESGEETAERVLEVKKTLEDKIISALLTHGNKIAEEAANITLDFYVMGKSGAEAAKAIRERLKVE